MIQFHIDITRHMSAQEIPHKQTNKFTIKKLQIGLR